MRICREWWSCCYDVSFGFDLIFRKESDTSTHGLIYVFKKYMVTQGIAVWVETTHLLLHQKFTFNSLYFFMGFSNVLCKSSENTIENVKKSRKKVKTQKKYRKMQKNVKKNCRKKLKKCRKKDKKSHKN